MAAVSPSITVNVPQTPCSMTPNAKKKRRCKKLHTSPTPSPASQPSQGREPESAEESTAAECSLRLDFEEATPESHISNETLTPDQEEVLSHALAGHSIFFTGSAGTGKTFLLKRIITSLRAKGLEVAITASTGIAATHLMGCTVHSFAGIGTGEGSQDQLLKMSQAKENKTRKGPKGVGIWRSTDALILDEISMLRAELFDSLEYCARMIRGSQCPFGGIQVVACGDFLQLPPVAKAHDKNVPAERVARQYAFQAESWKFVFPVQLSLHTVLRQSDSQFASILNQIRLGDVSDTAVSTLLGCRRPLPIAAGIAATRLYTRNIDVDAVNQKHLQQLPGDSVTFKAMDRFPDAVALLGKGGPPNKLLASSGIPKEVALKVGAQVMLTRNLCSLMANGSRGVVVAFQDGNSIPEADLPSLLHNCSVGEFRSWLKVNGQVPVVRFRSGLMRPILPERCTIGEHHAPEDQKVLRVQIPLRLAWALTIHKCQGMTLDYVVVSLRDVFEVGQAYVALSRAQSLEGLQIDCFDASKVLVDKTAREFHDQLESAHRQHEDHASSMCPTLQHQMPYSGEAQTTQMENHRQRATEYQSRKQGKLMEERFLKKLADHRLELSQKKATISSKVKTVHIDAQSIMDGDDNCTLSQALKLSQKASGTLATTISLPTAHPTTTTPTIFSPRKGVPMMAVLDRLASSLPQCRKGNDGDKAITPGTQTQTPLSKNNHHHRAQQPRQLLSRAVPDEDDSDKSGQKYMEAARQRYLQMRYEMRSADTKPTVIDFDDIDCPEQRGNIPPNDSGGRNFVLSCTAPIIPKLERHVRQPLREITAAQAQALVKRNSAVNAQATQCPLFEARKDDAPTKCHTKPPLLRQNRQTIALFHRLNAAPHRR